MGIWSTNKGMNQEEKAKLVGEGNYEVTDDYGHTGGDLQKSRLRKGKDV